MKTNVVRIGNSRGIRIPKKLLEQCQLEDEVELEVVDNQLRIRRVASPRSGWSDAFRCIQEKGDDNLLDEKRLAQTEWEKTEWEW